MVWWFRSSCWSQISRHSMLCAVEKAYHCTVVYSGVSRQLLLEYCLLLYCRQQNLSSRLDNEATWRWHEPTCQYHQLEVGTHEQPALEGGTHEPTPTKVLNVMSSWFWPICATVISSNRQKAMHMSPPCMSTGGLNKTGRLAYTAFPTVPILILDKPY